MEIKEAISKKGQLQKFTPKSKYVGYLHRYGLLCLAKAFNSVGISKLCCPGLAFVISFVMGITIQDERYPTISGTYGNLCPDDKLLSLDQLKLMKREYIKRFQA